VHDREETGLTKRAFWRQVITSSGSPWGVGGVAGGCAGAMAARVKLVCLALLRSDAVPARGLVRRFSGCKGEGTLLA
jgi:hypothetical protein